MTLADSNSQNDGSSVTVRAALAVEPAERLRRLQEQLVASGKVRLVSEAELVQERKRHQARRAAFKEKSESGSRNAETKRATGRCERRQVKRELSQHIGQRDGAGRTGHASNNFLAESEDDFNETDGAALARSTQLNHSEQQAAFVAEGRGEDDGERMLELLFAPSAAGLGDGFDVSDPARVSRGRWVRADDLIHVHRINTPHSRASELRGGTKTHRGHPLVLQFNLEIDQMMIGGFSCYSVCFKEHSERLKREKLRHSSTAPENTDF